MATVLDLLRSKGTRVLTVTPDVSVFEATTRMNAHKCGAVVVVHRDEPGRVAGIFTERDVLKRVVGELRYADLVCVGEVMTTDIATCDRLTLISDASQTMRDRRIRHLPVLNEAGELCGLISIGDINAWHVHEQQSQIEQLMDYVVAGR
jgi:CBS domain-containing protein